MNFYRLWRTILPAVVLLALAVGCGRKTAQNTEPEPPPAQGSVQSFVGGPSAPAQGAVRRGMEIQKAKGHLTQFKVFYLQYKTERNKPPATLNDFLGHMQRDDPTLAKLLQEQAFTVNFKPNMPGDALLAYVSWEDGAGNRAVLTEAGEIKVMNRTEFDAALKR
jgi:hypothetical protein